MIGKEERKILIPLIMNRIRYEKSFVSNREFSDISGYIEGVFTSIGVAYSLEDLEMIATVVKDNLDDMYSSYGEDNEQQIALEECIDILEVAIEDAMDQIEQVELSIDVMESGTIDEVTDLINMNAFPNDDESVQKFNRFIYFKDALELIIADFQDRSRELAEEYYAIKQQEQGV